MSGQVRSILFMLSDLPTWISLVLTPTGTLIVGYTNELIQELNNVLRDTPGKGV